jgi:hypothetical protein
MEAFFIIIVIAALIGAGWEHSKRRRTDAIAEQAMWERKQRFGDGSEPEPRSPEPGPTEPRGPELTGGYARTSKGEVISWD